ncbi:hypothetical protein ACFSKL_09315 [Belliella marina]|uniref:Outer membrane protein beta-barrel domain-containing protein n=1 Tax=Belliella marina TaxID=1644146 RepID=A0ABW4VJV7_9BACT
MKLKLTIAVFLAFVLGVSLQFESQAQSFQKDDWVIQAGLGLGNTFSYGGSWGLPLGAGVEYGIAKLEKGAIGIGGDLGFVSLSGLNVLFVGAKASYHFNELFELTDDRWDIYGGLGLYFRQFNFEGMGSMYSFNSGLYPAVHVGARYYFTENVGMYGELGNNWGWLNVGVAFKLK